MDATAFLAEHPKPQPWSERHKGLTGQRFFAGQGRNPIEVAVAIAASRPTWEDARALWRKRQGGRPSPVLLVMFYEDGARASVCGPVGDNPPVFDGLDPGQVERLSAHALNEPDRHAAVKSLSAYLPETGEDLPGIRNAGLMSAHALQTDVRSRSDWLEACKSARPVLTKRGRALVEALGFEVESRGTGVDFLLADGVKTAVAAFLDDSETPDGNNTRFNGVSPVSYALSVADREGLPFVVLTRGPQIRLYAAPNDVGVGRKGRAETYIEANLALLPDDRAGFLTLLFGSAALSANGSFHALLERSREFATDLGSRLRERLYQDVVPRLATVIGRKGARGKTPDLDFHYQQALVILFRLLFVAYAEDKELLPLHRDGNYKTRALKTLARELAARDPDAAFDRKATTYWTQIKQLWAAIDGGDSDLGVPQYNGGLFSEDPAVYPVGAAIAKISLSNAEIGPALEGMLVDAGRDTVRGPVDFRSLSVREFGTIYEGLLESSLSLAPSDLALDKDQNFVPAKGKAPIVVRQGEVYLHNRSGARKATGSYFTKPFAVEHLLNHALKPALQDHLARVSALLDAGEEHKAADAFFDFRCADIAMGSGHFLVAAVDHIEASLSSFLADHAIPGVLAELERLRKAALDALGQAGASTPIEDSTLLRRQVARRCIYGVDKNKIAVELARVAMWIHTFVPGLPLSFLDHNLVHGDSLTGIGTLQEAADLLAPEAEGQRTVFSDQIEDWLGRARDALARLARTVDGTAKEVSDARAAHAEAQKAIKTAHQLFNLLVAVRLGEATPLIELTDQRVSDDPGLKNAQRLVRDLGAVHFPVVFPEVFLRGERAGFDCLIGNPPWEKLHVERHGFWALRFPGLRGLPIADQNKQIDKLERSRPDLEEEFEAEATVAATARAVLMNGPYPGLGTGHPDLFKAFAFRFWQLACEGGRIGVVLPRGQLAGSGGAEWREEILTRGVFADVTMLLNTGRWAFDMEPRYTIGLVSVARATSEERLVALRGPFASMERFVAGTGRPAVEFPVAEFRTWTTGAAFPLLPSEQSREVFLKLRKQPRFDARTGDWRARPVQGDLNATTNKDRMKLTPRSTDGLWPVYKGESFDLWQPDTGTYYSWADPDKVCAFLQNKRRKQQRHSKSAMSEFPTAWAADTATLPARRARIAFRDITRATDSRTVRVALIPPERFVTHKAPYLLFPKGDARDEAYLLGVLASIPLDWYARTIVEINLTFEVLNAFPIPRPHREDPLRRRVADLAGRLAAVDKRFHLWATAVGVPVGSVKSDDEKQDMIAELDAAVAHSFGLELEDVRHIFETFHVGWDYNPRLERVLDHFKRLQG